MAATHVADGLEAGTDHAEQLAHLCALQIMRKLAQSIQSICTAAAVSTRPPRSEQSRARSRRWNGRFDSGFQRGTTDIALVQGQASHEADIEVRETSSRPEQSAHSEGPNPVHLVKPRRTAWRYKGRQMPSWSARPR